MKNEIQLEILSCLKCDEPILSDDEYYDIENVLAAETQALARWCAEHGRNGAAAPVDELADTRAALPDPVRLR